MKLLIVGISDCLVTGDVSAVIATYGLGSCIALAVHDRVARVGGLLHFMLPDSALDAARAERNPFAFADSGIPVLLEAAYAMGAQKRPCPPGQRAALKSSPMEECFRWEPRTVLPCITPSLDKGLDLPRRHSAAILRAMFIWTSLRDLFQCWNFPVGAR
jgi:hypothetical protein